MLDFFLKEKWQKPIFSFNNVNQRGIPIYKEKPFPFNIKVVSKKGLTLLTSYIQPCGHCYTMHAPNLRGACIVEKVLPN